MKEEKFPHTREPLHWQRWGLVVGKLQSHKESTAIGVQRIKWRDSFTEDQYRPALTSLRGLSTQLPGWVGPGS